MIGIKYEIKCAVQNRQSSLSPAYCPSVFRYPTNPCGVPGFYQRLVSSNLPLLFGNLLLAWPALPSSRIHLGPLQCAPNNIPSRLINMPGQTHMPITS